MSATLRTLLAVGMYAFSLGTAVSAPVPKPLKPAAATAAYAVGVYEGASPRQRGGQRVPGVVTVTVPEGKGPIVLVLTAYEPVVWKVEAPKGAVSRVIASGYHEQKVEGLDEKVEVTTLSYKAGNKDYFFAYQQPIGPKAGARQQADVKRRYEQMEAAVKKATGLEVAGFQGAYSADAVTVDLASENVEK